MANRVSVSVNVNDLSRSGIRSVRNSLDNLRRQIGDDAVINVTLNDRNALNRAGRLRNAIRDLDGENVNIRVSTIGPDRESRNRLTRSLTRTLAAPFRIMGRTLGGILSDGLGQGIIQAFRAAGPVGMAVLTAIIVGTLSAIGAALSGLLITLLGAAFVGIGVVSAAQSKEIKAQWSDTLASLKENFAEVGKPLIPVLDDALERLERMGDKAAPKLTEALDRTAPATDKFINRLMDGFESFGEHAFDRIMEAWHVFAPVFGDQWDEFMGELGDAFGDMADLVREHPTEIAAALELVFEALELIVRTVTFFGEVWVTTMNAVFDSVGFVIGIIKTFTEMILNAFGSILDGAVAAFGWIPGLGDGLETAQGAFNSFKEGVIGKLTDMKAKADTFGDSLDKANRKRQLEADISLWQRDLTRAREDLKKTTSQKAKAKLEADIRALQSKLARARSELNGINGRTATTYVDTVYRSFRQGERDYTNGKAHGGVVGMARGGVKGAQSGGVRGNMTLVGEAGPELVQLPTGSRVRTNPDTRRLMNGQGGGSGVAVLDVRSSGRPEDDFLVEWIRRAVTARGGNVQLVFGRKGA